MPALGSEDIERVFRQEHGRAVAVLVRSFGDIDLAEEAVQDAFAEAVRRWPERRPAAQPGRLDHHHRAQPRHRPSAPRVRARRAPRPGRPPARPRRAASPDDGESEDEEGAVPDDRLRLIFTCCHPALSRRRAGGAHPAPARRAHHAGDRPRVPGLGAHDGAAARPRQGQDPRCRHPLPRAPRRGPARPPGAACCASSTSSSTRATPPAPARSSCATTCAPRPSASAGSSSS